MTKTAAEIAREYSTAADWVPCDRRMPPPGEEVLVLFGDGYQWPATLASAGQVFLMQGGAYRYVPAIMWKPIGEKGRAK